MARIKAQMPDRFLIQRGDDFFELSWKWLKKDSWLLFVFTAMWTGTWIVKFNSLPQYVAFIGVGVAGSAIYMSTAVILNTSRVRVTLEFVAVKHGPMPSIGNKVIPTSEIEQLYCLEKTEKTDDGKETFSYSVEIIRPDQPEITLLRSLELDEAIFVEQEVEAFLNIEDHPVEHEY